jgi:hypothetical protein
LRIFTSIAALIADMPWMAQAPAFLVFLANGRKGEFDADLLRVVLGNVRIPEKVRGDLRAQHNANHVGAEPLSLRLGRDLSGGRCHCFRAGTIVGCANPNCSRAAMLALVRALI